MRIEPGTRLGPYEVLAPIGEPPAERYKASDTRRHRIVALTVLPEDVSEQPEMQARLERDAKVISALNHPNIHAPIDVGHQDPSTDFVVTEYVEGDTLAQRIARGPLDLEEALTIAIAMVDSLDRAHRHGVVHGGLNPFNVVLAPGGPRLLDFGLARLAEHASPTGPSSMATTRTSITALSAVPAAGARYMAPEQVAGRAADARSDIFAFGTVLYEILTGKPAFQEKTLALLIAAVQSVDPEPVSKLRPELPAALDYVVGHCLSRDARQRFQTALDVKNELEWIARGDGIVATSVPAATHWWTRNRVAWPALAAAALLAAGLSASTVFSSRTVPDPPEVRFVVPSLPTGTTPVAISPDGRWLAAGINGGAIMGLSIDSVTAQTLIEYRTGNAPPTQPFFSADSRSIAYFVEGKLMRAEIGGGPPQIICDAPPQYSAGAWNHDGVILFPAAGVIHRVLAAGGQPTPVTALDESKGETEHLGPSFLPDGRRFLFLAVSSQQGEGAVYAGSLDSPERTRLFTSDAKAAYAEPGYLLFNRGNTVFAQAFDADALTVTGEPIRVASGVPLRVAPAGLGTSAAITRSANFAVSQTGVLAYRRGPDTTTGPGEVGAGSAGERRLLFWFDRGGQSVGTVGTPGTYAGIDLSPDGRRFAVHRHEGAGGDNWYFDLAQGRMQRLTFDASQENSSPVWSPDGTRIAFGSRRNNRWGLYVKPVDGTAPEELIVESDVQKMPASWSPDGRQIVYWQDSGQSDVWAVSLDDRKPRPLLQEPYLESSPQVSPDGRWLAYASSQTGRGEIYVKPFPEGAGGPWQVSTDGGQFPRWRGDGKELYFYYQNSLIAADIRVTGSSVDPGVPRMLFRLPNPNLAGGHPYYIRYAVTADGQRFLFSLADVGAGRGGRGLGGGPLGGASLADALAAAADQGTNVGVAPQLAPQAPVTVVLNWPRMLGQK